MNLFEFAIKQGWPASTETWEWLQNMMLQVQQCSALGGATYIISGCVENGNNVGAGWVAINGEVLPLDAGLKQPNVIIVETITKRQFFGGVNNDYYKERKVVFGTGTTQYSWASFSRNNPSNGVLARLDKVEKMLKPLMGYNVAGTTYYGSWLFWGRPASEIPAGWEAVPDADWKGRVPVVLDATQPEFNTVGKVGGAKTHTLSTAEMPAHVHPVSLFENGTGNSSNYPAVTDNSSILIDNGSTGSTGGGQAHNNIQPYKVVMFIRFSG